MKKPFTLATVVLLAVLGVTACASPEDAEPTSTPTSESPSETATSTPTTEPDLRGANGYTLPSDWPASVPTLNAPIIFVQVTTPVSTQHTNVKMQVDDHAAAYAEARQLLLDAGFSIETDETYQEGLHGIFHRTPWAVQLTSHDTATPNIEYWLYQE